MSDTPAIVTGLFDTVALPCDKTGRPLDPVARSWWDAGFRCVGYVPPPPENFARYIRQVRQAERSFSK